MSEHAVLSASSAHRWLVCTPSARLEREFEDKSTPAAAEGTAAHALAEHKLRRALKLRSKKPHSQYDCDDMDACADAYAAFVVEESGKHAHPIVLVEQRLDFSRYVPDGFGTGDCVIIAGSDLHVIDFKYGQGVVVEAEGNPQMKLYALGALEVFDCLYDIQTVSMTVYQPRREHIHTHTMSKDDLCRWAEEVLAPAAAIASEGGGEYVSGEHCRFCRAAAPCRARADAKMSLARYEFAMPPVLTDEEVEDILDSLDDLVSWANGLREYALQAALAGKAWSRYKLVEGRSVRRYTDEDAVARAAGAAGFKDIFKRTLIGIPEMEKLMTKAKFNEVLSGLIVKPPGKPTLVPVSDKRMSIDDFKEET